MKIRIPDFKKNNLTRATLLIELPISENVSQMIEEFKSVRKKGVGLALSKDKKKARVEIRLLQKRKDGIEILERFLDLIKREGSDHVTITSTIMFSYDTEEYETDPSLPVEFPESDARTEKVLLTGVKLNFADSGSSLKYTILDLEYCLTCGEYHTIINQVICRQDMPINTHLLLNAVKTARKYSQTFVKKKRK